MVTILKKPFHRSDEPQSEKSGISLGIGKRQGANTPEKQSHEEAV